MLDLAISHAFMTPLIVIRIMTQNWDKHISNCMQPHPASSLAGAEEAPFAGVVGVIGVVGVAGVMGVMGVPGVKGVEGVSGVRVIGGGFRDSCEVSCSSSCLIS